MLLKCLLKQATRREARKSRAIIVGWFGLRIFFGLEFKLGNDFAVAVDEGDLILEAHSWFYILLFCMVWMSLVRIIWGDNP